LQFFSLPEVAEEDSDPGKDETKNGNDKDVSAESFRSSDAHIQVSAYTRVYSPQ